MVGRQWWAFGPPLWASGPFLNAHIGSDDLGGHSKFFLMTFIPKFHILAAMKGKASKFLKNDEISSEKGTKEGCMFLHVVRAHGHVHRPVLDIW